MDIMGTRASALLLFLLIVFLATPGVAGATETPVSREVETATGMEMLGLAATSLTGVDIGSNTTTVTLAVDGQTQSVELDYASVLGTGAGGETNGSDLRTLAVLGVGAGAFMRFLRFLMRLGG